jgi:hypothetical protein
MTTQPGSPIRSYDRPVTATKADGLYTANPSLSSARRAVKLSANHVLWLFVASTVTPERRYRAAPCWNEPVTAVPMVTADVTTTRVPQIESTENCDAPAGPWGPP